MKNRIFSLALMSLLLFPACATEQMVIRMASPLMLGQMASIHEESDLELADRAIPAGIKMMEGLLKSDPENTELLLPLAEGLCDYAFSFIEDENPERASKLYLRGRAYASRALTLLGGPTQLSELSQEQFKNTVASIPDNAMPSLYWTGRCWAGWLMLNLDDLEALVAISKLEITMDRVLNWDATYDFAGPHIFFGAFYGSRPKLLGGNPEKSKHHFDHAVQLTHGKFLMAQYLYARWYAVRIQDRELFESLLNTVIESPTSALPERRLANEVAREKAQALLEDADVYF